IDGDSRQRKTSLASSRQSDPALRAAWTRSTAARPTTSTPAAIHRRCPLMRRADFTARSHATGQPRTPSGDCVRRSRRGMVMPPDVRDAPTRSVLLRLLRDSFASPIHVTVGAASVAILGLTQLLLTWVVKQWVEGPLVTGDLVALGREVWEAGALLAI